MWSRARAANGRRRRCPFSLSRAFARVAHALWRVVRRVVAADALARRDGRSAARERLAHRDERRGDRDQPGLNDRVGGRVSVVVGGGAICSIPLPNGASSSRLDRAPAEDASPPARCRSSRRSRAGLGIHRPHPPRSIWRRSKHTARRSESVRPPRDGQAWAGSPGRLVASDPADADGSWQVWISRGVAHTDGPLLTTTM